VAAIQSLGGNETEKRALELARSSKAAPRRSALRILAYFGYPSAFDSMVAAMSDPDQRLRDAGIGGLSFIESDRATEALLRASEDPAERTRSAAMKALGHRSPRGGRRRPRPRSNRRRAVVRYYASQSLGKLAVREMGPNIEKLLADPAGQVRVAAIEALAGSAETQPGERCWMPPPGPATKTCVAPPWSDWPDARSGGPRRDLGGGRRA